MNLVLELIGKYTDKKMTFEPMDIKSSVNHMMEAFKRKHRVSGRGKLKKLMKNNNDFSETILNM